MRFQALLAGAAMALVASVSANAAELVTNGGFETGDLSGWTHSGGFAGVQCPGPSFAVNSGNCSYFDGNIGANSVLSQIVATVSGQSYDYSFWLQSDGRTPNSFTASLGGVVLASLSNVAAAGYTHFAGTVVAASSNATLSFGFRNDPGFLFFDDVSLVSGAAAIPEPASWALMLAGFMGAGAAIRANRRRRAAAA